MRLVKNIIFAQFINLIYLVLIDPRFRYYFFLLVLILIEIWKKYLFIPLYSYSSNWRALFQSL